MEQILALDCLLPDARGRPSLCLVLSSNKRPRCLMIRLLDHLLGTGNPQTWLPGARPCVERGHMEEFTSGQHVVKSCRPYPGLVHFMFVVPPLQPRAVGPYLVWGTWSPSRLPLEGTWSYLDLLDRNRRPMVPGYKSPTKLLNENRGD
jgi:hypothetical protein